MPGFLGGAVVLYAVYGLMGGFSGMGFYEFVKLPPSTTRGLSREDSPRIGRAA